jgi:signal peptidase I
MRMLPDDAPKGIVRDYFETIVTCVIFVIFARTFVFQQSKIPTGSMIPTLLVGDYIMVNKFAFAPLSSIPLLASAEHLLLPVRDLKRGDIIVFKYPEEPSRDFIKRVIGLPGETLELRDKKVSINGQALDEPYVHFLEPPGTSSEFREVTSYDVRERYGPVTIPPNQYFVMGDNRDNSQDSRYWGFLPRDYIKGKALVIYWSYDAGLEDYHEESTGEALKGLGSVFVHFFTRTRWDRMMHQIR